VVDLLDAVGFDLVVVETVGVGQSELAVMEVADTSVVLLTPESGDTVQTMKAGLLEIADVFVVNKADRPGAERLVRDLESSVALDERPGWHAPVRRASALSGDGVADVVGAIEAHLAWCVGPGREEWRRRRGDAQVRLLEDLAAERARLAVREAIHGDVERRLRALELSPWDALEELP
jgi:LAO/AO transport system kinase